MRALEQVLTRVRRKVQLERILKGSAWLLGYTLAAFVLAVVVLSRHNFSDTAIFWCRLSLGVGFLAVFWWGIVRPLLRAPTSSRTALFIEERYPALAQRLSTAVELSRPGSTTDPDLRSLIQRDAASQVSHLQFPRFFWPRISGGAAIATLVFLITGLGLFLGGPAEFKYGAGLLLGSWTDDHSGPLYRIEVSPGNSTVAERADLTVGATLVGFESNAVNLFVRYSNDASWDSTRMSVSEGSGVFGFTFYDLRDSLDYYVEADGIRSPEYRIDVSELPQVARVRFTLRFPGYTGLSEVVLDDETLIRGLRGTEVRAQVEADGPAAAGELRFESGVRLTLQQLSDSLFEGTFKIDQNDYFRVWLANDEGVVSPASQEFSVEVMTDQPPNVSFSYPGRDRRVTNIEEVFTEIEAEDDYGLRELTLHFSVNGGAEQVVKLGAPRGSRQYNGSHVFYLEEYDLEPGDFVAYYARGEDAVTSSVTDIYFLEVEPYEREFRQSQSMGGGAGAGQRETELSKRQKEIVVATHSLVQEKDRYTPKELVENSQTLGLLQQRLQGQAQTIIERFERRADALPDPRLPRFVEMMRTAVEHMKPAEKALNAIEPEKALPDEQKSLQQLLRAEALFNEVQVSMSQSGGQGETSAEDLADLVDLELDRTKNQYETLQQNRQQQRDEALDEAVEKLKELARRAEQEVERQKRQAQAGTGSGGNQDQLIEELEKMARELARLSRRQQDDPLSRASRELERAARDLRRASSSGQSSQESAQATQQAMERLQQAQQSLARQQESEVRQAMNQLKEQADQLVQDQENVLDSLSGMETPEPGEAPGEDFLRQLRNLYWEKQDLQESLQKLEGNLHQASRRLGSDEPAAARKLKEAGLGIRDRRVPDKMHEGSELLANGLVGMAERREQDVAGELRRLAEQISQAEEALGQGRGESEEEKLRRALAETGSMIRKLESLRARAEEQQRAQSGDRPGTSEEGGEPSAEPGSESRQAEANQQEQNQGSPAEGDQSGAQGASGEGGDPQVARSAGGQASSGIDPGNLRREWQERVREGRELQQMLGGIEPEWARDLGRSLRNMGELELDKILNDPEEVQRLKSQILDGFHELELRLSQALRDRGEDFLRPVDGDDVVPEYREQVEEYYRRLAERRE